MKIIKGRYDGSRVVLDGPAPEDAAAGSPVRMVFGDEAGSSALSRIAGMAVAGELPPDFAAQHEHYLKGRPRK